MMFEIQDKSIGDDHPVFFIAEAGVNHEASLDLAKLLIDEAKEGGADAIKFQTYKAESIASKFSPAYWDLTQEPTENQYELFKKYDMFWKKDFEELKIHCDKSDIEFLSTPFDTESACFLNDLMDVFKISSSVNGSGIYCFMTTISANSLSKRSLRPPCLNNSAACSRDLTAF